MSKAMDILIGILLVFDTFFVCYAIGLNSRHVLVVDSSLAPAAVAATAPPAAAPAPVSAPPPPQASLPLPVNPGKFDDIGTAEARLKPLVEKAAEAGIIDPTKDQKFRPNDPVTRGDFTRWMVRVRQVKLENPSTATYADVDQFNPYYREIEGATRANLVQGYAVKGQLQKEFKPEQYISREEFAVMYCTFSGKRSRAEKLTANEIDEYLRYQPSASAQGDKTYKDVGDINDWARKWVAVAHQAGVLEQCFDVKPDSQLDDRRYFRPQQRMTRAEAVGILVKLYGVHLSTPEDIAKNLEGQGLYYERPGLYKEAEVMYANALALNEKAHGSSHLEVAKSANNLASLYQTLGDLDKAEGLYKRSMDMSGTIGKDNTEVTRAMNGLGYVYRGKGKFADASSVYKGLLDIDSKVSGAQSAAVASDLDALYKLASVQGQAKAAAGYQARAMEIVKKLPGATRIQSLPAESLKVSAAPARAIKDKWALIVGISQFKDPNINLRFAAKDASDFRQYLVSEAGFAPDHVKLLTDKDATRDNIVGYLGSKWLGRLANPDDLVVVYVSSHGSTAKEEVGVNFLAAYDTDRSSLLGTGIPMQWLSKIIAEQVHCDRVLLILDVCHSGAATGQDKGLTRDLGFDVDKVAVGTGQAVLCSSLADQLSWESKKYQNSVFTRYLIEAFRSKGKATRLDEAFQFLRDRVQQEVLRDRYEMQTPVLKKSWEGDDLVLSVQPTSPRSAALEVK